LFTVYRYRYMRKLFRCLLGVLLMADGGHDSGHVLA
jgi:hypothetical protein